jgi:hypothetical protein
MVLLSIGLNTPSLRLRESNATLHSAKFNIDRDIPSNDDNLSYGNIVSVHVGPDDYITALTDDGIDELRDMLASARVSLEEWHSFLEDFVA